MIHKIKNELEELNRVLKVTSCYANSICMQVMEIHKYLFTYEKAQQDAKKRREEAKKLF